MTASRFSSGFWSKKSSRAELVRPLAEAQQSVDSASSVAEVILSCESGTVERAAGTAQRRCRPRGIFVPENYEQNYAYPLVVWLHETGGSERDIAEILPRISMRNYLGLALRGTRHSNPAAAGPSNGEPAEGFGWSRSDRTRRRFHDEFLASVNELRRDYHMHTERVFLVGAEEGGTIAWDLFLAHPEWFAGLAVLGGRFPWRRRPLRHFRALREKQLLLAPAVHDESEVEEARQVGRLMHTAGLGVCLRPHSPRRRACRPVLRQIDHWIMQAIGGCQ